MNTASVTKAELQTSTDSQTEIKRAAQLSIAEIGLGSVGHGLKIPLTGQLLSLNQLGFLLNAVNRDGLAKSAVFEISSISAILKSFSPAGQKLGPMLSIAMQGFLFWFGVTLFGLNIVGQCMGAVLLSLWAFIQPFVTLAFIYGLDLEKLSQFYVDKIKDDYEFLALSLAYALLAVVAVKVILALTMTVTSRLYKKEIRILSADQAAKYLQLNSKSPHPVSPLKGAFKDMTRPLFLLSFALMLVFLWQSNGSLAQKIWMGLRPLALAFVLFYILRSPWMARKLLEWSQKSPRFNKIYSKTQAAFDMIKSRSVQ